MSAADIFESIAWILLHQMDGYAFWIINEAVKSWQHFCETDLITSNRSSRWTDKQHVTDVTVLFRLTIARKPIHYQTNGNQMWSHVLTFIVNVTTDYYFFCFIFFFIVLFKWKSRRLFMLNESEYIHIWFNNYGIICQMYIAIHKASFQLFKWKRF